MKDYTISSKVLIRTHRNSFCELNSLNEESIESLFSQANIQEAIYLASPDLYDKLKIFPLLENKEKERVRNAFVRYINRMSTRCTPFGLFAGCSMGTFGENTNLIVSKKIIRHTRLDMNYLCSLSQYISNAPETRSKLKYFPNNTLYIIGNEYRYIEYNYLTDKRIHRISSVKKTSYLDQILKISQEKASIEELCSYLTSDYIQKEDALNYIYDLIQSQILISELDPTVTGEELLTSIISILNNIDINNIFINSLKSIQNIMQQIDVSGYNSINKYEEIENLVKKIGAPYNKKYLLQVDINNVFVKNIIPLSIRKEIESTVAFLNKIIPARKNDDLLRFQEQFSERFGEKEVLLMVALDPEIGIGYPIENGNKDLSKLFDNFYLPKILTPLQNINYGIIQSVLLKKMSEQNNLLSEIEIKDEDFKDIIESQINLPDTFSVLFEIISDDESGFLIRLKSIGNNSAANLLARFAYTDKKIEDFVNEIAQKEQTLKSDVILAEIAHLPDSRIGNVLYRPHFREYEIVYLANSSKPKDNVIYASDLFLSVKHGKLFLRSNRLNRGIVPHFTTAHNYSLSTIPIHRFLCDMQYQNQRESLTFDIGFLKSELCYIPRIRYKNTILSPAIWNIKVDDMKYLISMKDDEDFLNHITAWRENKKIPTYSLLSDSDNELFIDWNNVVSLHSFLSVVKNRVSFRLIEFLHDKKKAVIKDGNGNCYLNEFIVSFLKDEKK